MRPPRPWSTMRRAARWPTRNWAVSAKRMTHSNSSSSTSRNGVECAGRGVGDEHVEAAERVGELVDHGVGAGDRGEVDLAVLDAHALGLALGHRLAQVVLVGVPGEAEVEAAARERDGGPAADAGVGAGDDRDGHAGRPSRSRVGYSPPMPDSAFTTAYGREQAGARAISTTQLLGQVLFLVAIALGFCALGTWLGRDLESRDRADHLLRRLRDAAGVVLRRRALPGRAVRDGLAVRDGDRDRPRPRAGHRVLRDGAGGRADAGGGRHRGDGRGLRRARLRALARTSRAGCGRCR